MAIDPEDLAAAQESRRTVAWRGYFHACPRIELAARIAALEAEIARCREAIAVAPATKSAADTFFKTLNFADAASALIVNASRQ